MTLIPVPFRRRLPLVPPDPALPAPLQPGLSVPGGEGPTPAVITLTPSPVVTPPEASSGTVPEKSSKIPPRWAVALVALVLILVAALIGLGHPVSYVLEALAGGGWLGIELVRLLNREL